MLTGRPDHRLLGRVVMRPNPDSGTCALRGLGENDSGRGALGSVDSRRHANTASEQFDNVVTLPTDERVVGDPRCCWSATAGGRPSMSSTSGTAIW